jgi:hypothetical protein
MATLFQVFFNFEDEALVKPFGVKHGSHPRFLIVLPEDGQIVFILILEGVRILCSVHHAWLYHDR